MAVAGLLVFMAQLATTLYLPSLPAVMRDFGISRNFAELSVSLFVIGAAVPVVFWGIAAGRYGRRGPLLVSLALFVVTSGLLAVLRSPEGLLILRTLQGAGAGGSAITARIVVRDRWSGDELARRLSVLSVAFITAMGAGQFLGGLIARYSHWRTGFLLLAATGTLAAALSFTLQLESGSDGPTHAFAACVGIARQRRFLLPACAGGFGFATIVLLQEVSPFVFQQHYGLSADTYGGIGLLLGLAYLAGALLVNRLVARTGAARLLLSGAFLMAAAAALMAVLWLRDGPSLLVFIALYGAITFGQSVLFPNSMAIAANSDPEQGAYAVSLCGFLQQSMAGAAAAVATALHEDLTWALVATGLATAALLTAARRV